MTTDKLEAIRTAAQEIARRHCEQGHYAELATEIEQTVARFTLQGAAATGFQDGFLKCQEMAVKVCVEAGARQNNTEGGCCYQVSGAAARDLASKISALIKPEGR